LGECFIIHDFSLGENTEWGYGVLPDYEWLEVSIGLHLTLIPSY